MNSVINFTNKNILMKNIAGSFIFKGLSLIIQILMVPAYIEYFTNKNFLGIWFVIISIVNWIVLFDFGIGNGLRNRLIESIVNKNDKEIRENISSSYAGSLIISITFFLIGSVLVYFINWSKYLNIGDSIDDKTINRILLLTLFIVTIQILLKNIVAILNAIQKTFAVNLLLLISNIIIYSFLLYQNTFGFNLNNINLMLIVYGLAINLPLLILTLIVFKFSSLPLPKIMNVKSGVLRLLVTIGLKFFYIQIMFMLIVVTNEMLISYFYSTSNVVDYQILFKLFYTVATLFSLISNPIWSALVKADKENKKDDIVKIKKIMRIFTVFFILLLILIGFFSEEILNIWIGEDTIQVEKYTIAIFVLFVSLMILNFNVTTFANGFNLLKEQIFGYTLIAVFRIPLMIFLNQFNNHWSNLILATSILMIVYLYFQSKKIQKKYFT